MNQENTPITVEPAYFSYQEKFHRNVRYGAHPLEASTLYVDSVSDMLSSKHHNHNEYGKMLSSKIDEFVPFIDKDIINYNLLEDMIRYSRTLYYRGYETPFLMPTGSKIFASIYVPRKWIFVRVQKLSKETIEYCRKVIKYGWGWDTRHRGNR